MSSEGDRMFAISPRSPVWVESSTFLNSSANCSAQTLHAGGGSQGFSQKGVVLLTLSFVGIGLLLVSITYYYFRSRGLLPMFKCWTLSSGARPLPVADVERVDPSLCLSIESYDIEETSSIPEVPTADATQLTTTVPVDEAAKLQAWKAEGSLSDVEYIIAKRILTNDNGLNWSFMQDLRYVVHSHKAGEISDRDFLVAKSRILLSITTGQDDEVDHG